MSNFKTKAEHLKHLHECLREDMEMLFNSLNTLDSIAEQAKEPTAGVLKLMGNAWNMVRGMAVALDVASEMAVKLVEQSLLEQPPKPASEPKDSVEQPVVTRSLPEHCNGCQYSELAGNEWPCSSCTSPYGPHNFYEPAGLVEELSKKAKPEPDLELEANGCRTCKHKHDSNLLFPCNDCNGINRWETDKTERKLRRCSSPR